MKWLIISALALAAAASAADKGADAAAGKTIFLAKCATCHGKDGTGNPKMATMYKIDAAKLDVTKEETLKKPADELAKVVMNGKEKMKGFKDKLKEAEIADVVAYVQSLAPAKSAAAPK